MTTSSHEYFKRTCGYMLSKSAFRDSIDTAYNQEATKAEKVIRKMLSGVRIPLIIKKG